MQATQAGDSALDKVRGSAQTEGQAIGRQTRFIPVTDWPKHHPWPPIGGLRHLIFYGEKNGFARCLRKIGTRVLIDEAEFFRWVDEHSHECKPVPSKARGRRRLSRADRVEVEDALTYGALGAEDAA